MVADARPGDVMLSLVSLHSPGRIFFAKKDNVAVTMCFEWCIGMY